MIRVALIDDHLSVVQMLRAVVEDLDGFAVAGAAASAAEACELCQRARADIAVVDLGLGADSGLVLIAALRTAAPRTRVLVFSGVAKPRAVRAALAAGAHGFVPKQAGLDELQGALRAVAAGRLAFPALTRGPAPARPRATVRLSTRDRELLRAIGEGLGSKAIAARLGMTVHAVGNLRLRLMRRANLRGTAQLARYAVSLGLVPDEVDGAADPE